MAFKFIILSAFVAAVANAGILPAAYHHQSHLVAAPQLALHSLHGIHDDGHDSYAHPQYSYSYGVHDLHTGDIKNQHEVRDGDVVKGEYSLVEPDGSKRTVKYSADAHNGFNAVVHKEAGHHPVAVHAAPLAIHAAPAIHAIHAAPALSYQHAAPALSYQHAAPALSYQHAAPALSLHHAAPLSLHHGHHESALSYAYHH